MDKVNSTSIWCFIQSALSMNYSQSTVKRSLLSEHMTFIRRVAFLSVSGRPMVVSSGMQSMETMRRVYKTVKEHNQNFAILQCTSAYPLEAEDVNLRVITVRRIP